MDVVIHQAVRKTAPPLPDDDLPEKQEIEPAVCVAAEDVLPPVAASEHVHNGTGFFFARLSGHA